MKSAHINLSAKEYSNGLSKDKNSQKFKKSYPINSVRQKWNCLVNIHTLFNYLYESN